VPKNFKKNSKTFFRLKNDYTISLKYLTIKQKDKIAKADKAGFEVPEDFIEILNLHKE